MIAIPYDYFLIAWFVLAAGSTAYVAFDQFNGNPEPTVMEWGFILVALYMGPFGLLPVRVPLRPATVPVFSGWSRSSLAKVRRPSRAQCRCGHFGSLLTERPTLEQT